MFDTTKDLRRVIIDTQQREKLVNNYRYKRQHNGADRQWSILVGVLCYLIFIGVLGGVITWGILIIKNGVCYG
jgi:hypothetical protein|tara:strand:+ start:1676 stop:1894 length:219 start_codon:yes stop_codon:yes gene_type:complete